LKMQNNITAFFDEYYEAFFDKLSNDPRHRHIIETRPDLALEFTP
jgi:hypothetical protein